MIQNIRTQTSVKVATKANPIPGLLRHVRVTVMENAKLQEVFRDAKDHTVEWIVENATQPLVEAFPDEDHAALLEVLRYLADEYTQIGDSILVLGEDGRALAKISDRDMYLPAPVPRESGEMAQPAPRLNPVLEGQIVQWVFNQGFEAGIVSDLQSRLPTTQLLREEGDRRLSFFTNQGRQSIHKEIETALPDLFSSATGITRAFLRMCPVGPKEEDTMARPFEFTSKNRRMLYDMRGRNAKFDQVASVRQGILNKWVEKIALEALQAVPAKEATVQEALTDRTSGLWVGSYDFVSALKEAGFQVRIFVVPPQPRQLAMYIEEPFGSLQLDNHEFWLRTREVHDTWAIEADCKGILAYHPNKMKVFEVTDVPVAGTLIG